MVARFLIVCACALALAGSAQSANGWSGGVAVGYWTKTWLTGCVAPGRCVMACGGYLDDRKFTVAVNPALRLRCGQKITVCQRRCEVRR